MDALGGCVAVTNDVTGCARDELEPEAEQVGAGQVAISQNVTGWLFGDRHRD